MFEIKVKEDKPSSGCMWCDDHWGMSRSTPGMHDIEADGVYSEVQCQKPEERARYEKYQQPINLAHKCWEESCKEFKAGTWQQRERYRQLLKERGLVS